MKNIISNAKVEISKAFLIGLCRLEIAYAVVVYVFVGVRFKRLHPVRDSRKREALGYVLRSKETAIDLAVERLVSI